ncbi:MAG: response regulator [Gammaproteobacteria bacterium]|nr:response regulator [Gammaproteobacteria bacterium]
MTQLNGLDAARHLREQLNVSLPIVALTANAFSEDTQASVDAGMNFHLTKPVVMSELQAAIDKLT